MNLGVTRFEKVAVATAEPAIAVRALHLSYGTAKILHGINLELPRGRALPLLGPSGSAKTTLLRTIAGLEAPDRGEIALNGQIVANPQRAIKLAPEKRGLGMVFQDYALWPHMSVARNVGFPLEMAGMGRGAREQTVMRALDRVGLGDMAQRRPSALSGGQQQRVGIARAVASGAQTILFDEPLSNLDRELRESMVDEIAQLVAELGLSALYVTHDHSEAFSLAHQVAVLRAGQIAQIATPEDLVAAPAKPWIAEFLRLGAILPVTPGQAPLPGVIAPAGATHVLLARRALSVCPPAQSLLRARVLRCLFRGEDFQLTLALQSGADIQITSPQRASPGSELGLHVAQDALQWFHEPTT